MPDEAQGVQPVPVQATGCNNKIIIEGLSLLQSIPPTTADKQATGCGSNN